MNKKNIIKYFVIFISLSATALFISQNQYDRYKKEILEQEKEFITATYNTITKSYKTHSEIYFSTKINTPYIQDLMKKANSSNQKEKDDAREELYRALLDSYNSMKFFKIKQLHFHLPNNESFLRFHRPEKYGDDLSGIRDTVAYVNRYKEPVAGFEEGKIFNGYRFIYPIIKDSNHYGSVEISVSMHEIIKHMRDEAAANVDFIIKKALVEDKVFKDELKNYIQSGISGDYLYENSINDDKNYLIEALIEKYENLKNRLSQDSTFNFSTYYENNFYITTFVPVYNKYSKQNSAYVIVSRPNISLDYHHKKNIAVNFVIIFLLALLVFTYYKIEKSNKDLKKKNNAFKEIQRIAKIGSWEFDAKTNKLTWSDEVYNIFSVSSNSFKPDYEAFLNCIHPEDRKRVDEVFKESIKQKRDYQVRHRVLRSDGSILYVNEAGYHTFDERGELIHTIGTVHDITNVIEYEQKIGNIENKLKSIVENIPDILFRSKIDEDMTMLFVNGAIEKITGYKAEGFIENSVRSYRSLIHHEDLQSVKEEIRRSVSDNVAYVLEYRIINSIGDTIWVRESGKKMIANEGNEIIEGLITNITDQKNAMNKLRKFIDIQDNIVVLTDGKTIRFANKKFFDFFGYENLEEFLKDHKCICDNFIKDDTFFHLDKMLPKEEHWIRSLLNLHARERVVSMADKDKKTYAFLVSINNYDPQSYIVSFSDISETMFEKLQLEEKAIRDQLTNAYNRTYFESSIENIIKNNQKQNSKTGVIIFDIDYFKSVNDNYGHAVGDDVLKTLVETISNFIRKDDKLIRWGGEEFIIFLNAKSLKDVTRQAEHLRAVIQNHEFNPVPSLTCSFGVALHEDETSIQNTIKKADAKLYEAKRNGRNRVEY